MLASFTSTKPEPQTNAKGNPEIDSTKLRDDLVAFANANARRAGGGQGAHQVVERLDRCGA